MATATLSGYLATATAVTWASGQSLDAAADDEWTDLSDEIDNSTDKHLFVDLEITLGSAAFSGVDSGIEVYLVPSLDGTNFGDWTGNVTTDEQENNQYFVGFVSTTGATEAQRAILRGVALPNGKFKFGFRNRGGVALSDIGGNAVNWRPHAYASA